MSDTKNSVLKTITKKFTLESYGKDKKTCLGNIFKKLPNAEYESVNGLIIQAEPLDVVIEEEKEKTTAKKIIGFFEPKETQDYYVKVSIDVRLKYIEL